VFGEYLYFKASSGKIYQENGQALPGEFADLLVSPVRAEWVETKKEDCPDMCPRKDEPIREVEVFKPASVGQVCSICNSPAYACMCHRMDGETDAELKKRRETHLQVKPVILDEMGLIGEDQFDEIREMNNDLFSTYPEGLCQICGSPAKREPAKGILSGVHHPFCDKEECKDKWYWEIPDDKK
jgi:hypothetical protein